LNKEQTVQSFRNKGAEMKDKIQTIRINLILLLKMIDEIHCTEEVNYDLFWKLEEINERLGDVELLIRELDEL